MCKVASTISALEDSFVIGSHIPPSDPDRKFHWQNRDSLMLQGSDLADLLTFKQIHEHAQLLGGNPT